MMGGNSQEMAQQVINQTDIKKISRRIGQILDGMDVKTRKSILRKGAAVIRKEARRRLQRQTILFLDTKNLAAEKQEKEKATLLQHTSRATLQKRLQL